MLEWRNSPDLYALHRFGHRAPDTLQPDELDVPLAREPGRQFCVSCGAEVREPASELVTFCESCLEWSRQDNLDDFWDDLGAPD